MSLQTRTNLQQVFEGVLNYCKVECAFKCKTKFFNSFRFKDPTLKDLISGLNYEFQWGLCNRSYFDESIRHLDIKSGEHTVVSPLTGKKVKPINISAVNNLLLTVLAFWLMRIKSFY